MACAFAHSNTSPEGSLQVYAPQNTSVPQNTSRIYLQNKIWKKHAKYFIFVNIYINFGVNWHINKENEYFNKNS